MSYTLMISACRGPIECAYAVGKLFDYIKRDAESNGHEFVVVEKVEATHKDCYHSITLNFDISAKHFCSQYEGSILWKCQSTFRPTHKRKNWFISVSGFEFPEVDTCFNLKDVEITTYRAGVGNGGQHINKTDSAVRVLHKPSGVVVEACEERSQHQNRKIGLLRLAKILHERQQEQNSKNQKQKWDSHNSIVRGNPVMTFEGDQFRKVLEGDSR